MNQSTHLIIAAACSLILSACGGSGGDTADSNPDIGAALMEENSLTQENSTPEQFAESQGFPDNASSINRSIWGDMGAAESYENFALDRYRGETEFVADLYSARALFASLFITGSAPLSSDKKALISDENNQAENLLKSGKNVSDILSDLIEDDEDVRSLVANESNATINLVKSCEQQGQAFIQADLYKDPQTDWSILTTQVRFDNCVSANDDFVTGGYMESVVHTDQFDIIRSSWGFDDLDFNIQSVEAKLNGAVSEVNECTNSQGLVRIKLLKSDHQGSSQVLTDLSHIDSNINTNDELCLYDTAYTTNLSGELYYSELGKVSIQTPKKFEFTANPGALESEYPEAYRLAYELPDTGHIQFSAEPNNSSAFQFEWKGSNLLDSNHELRGVITETAGDQRTDILSKSLIYSSVWLDMADTDSDTLTDGYEKYATGSVFNLKASEDSDNDGLFNLEEFQFGFDPTNANSHGIYPDQSLQIDLQSRYNAANDSNDLILNLVVDQFPTTQFTSDTIRHQVVTIAADSTLHRSTDIPFHQFPEYCESINELAVKCTITNNGETSFPQTLEFPIDSNAVKDNFTVIATLDDPYHIRPFSENEPVSTTIPFTTAISGDILVETLPVVHTLIGEPQIINGIVSVNNFPRPSDFVFLIDHVSAALTFPEIRFFDTSQNEIAVNCANDLNRAICVFNETPPNTSYEFEITLVTDDIGNAISGSADGHLEIRTQTQLLDTDLTNNTEQVAITAVHSTAALQSLLDDAEPGETAVLAAGTYIGTLDLGYKKIHVTGAEGEIGTTLISTDPNSALLSNIAARTTISNLTLQTTGAPVIKFAGENSTLEDSIIEPVSGLPHSLDHLFSLGESETFRLKGNVVRNWGIGSGNTCNNLLSIETYSTYIANAHIEQNVFHDLDCEVLFLTELSLRDATGGIVFQNNTIAHTGPVLQLGSTSFWGGEYRILNNIFYYTEEPVEILNPNPVKSDWLQSSKNILFGTEDTNVLDRQDLNHNGVSVIVPDLNVDPIFFEEQNDNFSLLETSPAIDAGEQPLPFVYTYDNFINADLAPADDEQIQAIDGNNDGVSDFDIGAIEYQSP